MKLLKTLVSIALASATALSLSACSDEELAFGTGLVVGVIVGDSGRDHHHHRPPPPRHRRGRRWSVDTNFAAPSHSVENNLAALSPSQVVAMKYGLSMAQADVLTAHLLPAREGDLSGLAKLGFEKADLQALMDGQNPSASTLSTLSQKLGLEISQAHDLIQNIKIDALVARDSMM